MPSSQTSKKTTHQPASPTSTEDSSSKYAAQAWLSGGVGGLEDVVVPSGQLCLVRRPGLEGLMKAGVLNRMDSLSSVVNEKHLKRVKGGKAAEEVDALSLLGDPKAVADVMDVVDKVVCHVVVKPEVHRNPNDVTRRQPGVVYADMIDVMDKMFIFNFVVGGTRDIESFRDEFDESVGGLEGVASVQAETE